MWKAVVEIADDRLGLVQSEPVMLERRNSAERMALQMLLGLVLAGRHGVKVIVEAFLLERHFDAAQERASGDSVDGDAGHGMSPSLIWMFPQRRVRASRPSPRESRSPDAGFRQSRRGARGGDAPGRRGCRSLPARTGPRPRFRDWGRI